MAASTEKATNKQLKQIIQCVSSAVKKGLDDFVLTTDEADRTIYDSDKLAATIAATVLAWLKNSLIYEQNLLQDPRNSGRIRRYRLHRIRYISDARFVNEKVPLPGIKVPVQLDLNFVFSDA